MNFYIENKSLSFIKKAYSAVQRSTNKEIFKAFIINYKGGFSSSAYYFFKKKNIYDIEYILYGTKGICKAIKFLNLSKNPISLTLIIDEKISENAKKIILKAKRTIKIIDKNSYPENVNFYNSFNKILFKTPLEDNIMNADIMHLYKFYETELQCKFSSCLGNNFYVDKGGCVHFCPMHLEKSIVGDITKIEDYTKNETFDNILVKAMEKRTKCKQECLYFSYCSGACPLEEGCCNFPELFEKNSTEFNAIINNNKNLEDVNFFIAKLIIKNIAYSE